ncbi:MAG: class B sortase [Lachnospiraceae bacterium]|nr:class B sortase [Lachnospiraceae bacterium]
MHMNKKTVRILMISTSFILLIISLYNIISIVVGYEQGNKIYDDAKSEFFLEENSELITQEQSTAEEKETSPVIENESNEKVEEDNKFDYQALYDYNNDAQGWIYLGNGYIDYPIVQSKDNDYYLRKTIDKKYNINGTPFVDYRCVGGLNSKHAILYGHNMKNNSMFGSLKNYYNNHDYVTEYPYFTVWVGEEKYYYYVFSIYKTKVNDTFTYQATFNSDEDYKTYIDECIERSEIKCQFEKADITSEDYILTLSTCAAGSKSNRLVLHCIRKKSIS